MSEPIIIVTVMRPEGDTGVQTHFRTVFDYLKRQGKTVQLVTPFDAPSWMVLPVFAVRKLIDLLNSSFSVWWYRHWHAVFLRLALKKALNTLDSCAVYAQCPLSADAALQTRKSGDQRVLMVAHFNISQADEWAGKGEIQDGGKLFNAIRQFERDVLPRLDGLVFVSEFVKREIAKLVPAIGNVSSRVIPNFLADPGVSFTEQKLLGDLICIGSLEPRKNQQYAIKIVAAAKKAGRELKLTLVGMV
jgi:glycosyltransferase involved in cell wall biosynthesis